MSASKIIDAAVIRFAKQGYEDASLAQIAEDAGIRKPSIYAHFSSKKQLFLKILEAAFLKEMDHVAALASEGSLEALKKYIFEIESRFQQDIYLLFWLRALYLPPNEIKAEIHAYDAQFVEALDNAIDISIGYLWQNKIGDFVDAKVFGAAYAGIIRGVHGELLYHGASEARQMASAMWAVFSLALNQCQ